MMVPYPIESAIACASAKRSSLSNPGVLAVHDRQPEGASADWDVTERGRELRGGDVRLRRHLVVRHWHDALDVREAGENRFLDEPNVVITLRLRIAWRRVVVVQVADERACFECHFGSYRVRLR
jgi:hypothetical protein